MSDLQRVPLGECPFCGAPRDEQQANDSGSVQLCENCETRFEEKGGLLVTTFHVVECPSDPEQVGRTEYKHEFQKMDGGVLDA